MSVQDAEDRLKIGAIGFTLDGISWRILPVGTRIVFQEEIEKAWADFLIAHRPTPSSALTKALEDIAREAARLRARFHHGLIEGRLSQFSRLFDSIDALDAVALEALRASPGGEGITHHENCGCSDTVIEQAEIRGAEWALIDGLSSAKPICPHGNFQERAAAIVASHRSKP